MALYSNTDEFICILFSYFLKYKAQCKFRKPQSFSNQRNVVFFKSQEPQKSIFSSY